MPGLSSGRSIEVIRHRSISASRALFGLQCHTASAGESTGLGDSSTDLLRSESKPVAENLHSAALDLDTTLHQLALPIISPLPGIEWSDIHRHHAALFRCERAFDLRRRYNHWSAGLGQDLQHRNLTKAIGPFQVRGGLVELCLPQDKVDHFFEGCAAVGKAREVSRE